MAEGDGGERLRRLLPLTLAACALAPASALAATVTSSADSGAGSLRSAVAAGGSVDFAPGLPQISLDSTIVATLPVAINDDEGDVTVAPSGSFTSGDPVLEFATGSATSSVQGVSFGGPIKVDDAVTGVRIERSPEEQLVLVERAAHRRHR